MTHEKPYANLLEESFPGIKSTIARCEALGFSWEDLCGRVFVKEKNGEVISHVSVLQCRVLLDNTWRKMGVLHAVCTKKEHQGQGIASALILEVLQWAKNHTDFQILFTDIPSFYERLGFAVIEEHRFALKQAFPKGSKLFSPLATPKDDDLFLRCFREREPLNQRFWIEDRGEIASFTTLFRTYPTYWSLYYCSEFDGFLSWAFEGKTLHLFDVVARKLPSFEQILEYLPQDVHEVYFYFPTDRFGIKTTAEPHLYDKGHVMVHGVLPSLKEPFMIAPLSRV